MIYTHDLPANSHMPQVLMLIFPLQPGLMWTSHHCDDGMETPCLHTNVARMINEDYDITDSFHKSPLFMSELNSSGVKAAFPPGNLNMRSGPGNTCCL